MRWQDVKEDGYYFLKIKGQKTIIVEICEGWVKRIGSNYMYDLEHYDREIFYGPIVLPELGE